MPTIKKLPSLKDFLLAFARNICFGLLLVIIALYVGMLGYHFFEKMSWVDAFCNASMILSGMGPVSVLRTTGGKIFAGCYALFSGLAFIIMMGVVFAPIIKRFLHQTHLDIMSSPESKK